MRVGQLRQILEKFQDDENICVLLWSKANFDYDPDDEVTLTDEAWRQICTEFEDADFPQVGEWIADAVLEKVERT